MRKVSALFQHANGLTQMPAQHTRSLSFMELDHELRWKHSPHRGVSFPRDGMNNSEQAGIQKQLSCTKRNIDMVSYISSCKCFSSPDAYIYGLKCCYCQPGRSFCSRLHQDEWIDDVSHPQIGDDTAKVIFPMEVFCLHEKDIATLHLHSPKFHRLKSGTWSDTRYSTCHSGISVRAKFVDKFTG